MCNRIGAVILAALPLASGSVLLRAEEIVEHPYPGITYITRIEAPPAFPRNVRMHIVLVDLAAPEVRFKLTPPGKELPLPDPAFATPGWPTPAPLFETVRQGTLAYLEAAHGQVAINSHFFAPFPVPFPATNTQGAYAYLIGLAASRGNVYSAFEAPFQNYALVTDSPAINIDPSNNASIVHRDPAFDDGKHVLENVTLWNALAGSAQIVTDGAPSLPVYVDATHPDGQLIPPGPANYSNSNSWYELINARSAVGLTQDNRTLVLFTVDIRPNTGPVASRSQGMRVSEVADLLIRDYGVYNALNIDGGGSTTLALQDPVDQVRRVVNVPSDTAPGRSEGSNLAVYSDGLLPATTAVASPAANANGWNKTSVTVSLDATDLRSGNTEDLPGWVDQVQYSLGGAQTGDLQVVPGSTASVEIASQGVTTVTYFATDAAGNDEPAGALTVRVDAGAPVISGMPGAGCTVGPADGKLHRVATVRSSDAVSGVAPGTFQVTGTSNGKSDRHHPDVVIRKDRSGRFKVCLRAEESRRGEERIYTLDATATDLADNVATATATCTVSRHGHGHHDDDRHRHDDDDCDGGDRDHDDRHHDDRGSR